MIQYGRIWERFRHQNLWDNYAHYLRGVLLLNESDSHWHLSEGLREGNGQFFITIYILGELLLMLQ